MKTYTIEQIKNEKIAIRIDDVEKGKAVVKAVGYSYTGSFPFDNYKEFCIAPSKNIRDNRFFHCSKNYYLGKKYTIIEFSQIDFQEVPEDTLKNIIIW